MPEREIYAVTTESKMINLLMLATGLGMFALGIYLPDPPPDPVEQWALRLMLIFFGLVSLVSCPRYKFSFRESGIVITFGYGNLIKIKIDRNKITHVGLIEWSPMKDFGGGGIKQGFGKFKGYWCYNIFRGTGIEIRTTERNFLLEIDDMERRRVLSMIGDYPRVKKPFK
jgi:hypothetical protein